MALSRRDAELLNEVDYALACLRIEDDVVAKQVTLVPLNGSANPRADDLPSGQDVVDILLRY